MFERLAKRAAQAAERQAALRREKLADAVSVAAPAGVSVGVEGKKVVLSGRGLGRRMARDPELRWLVVEAIHER